MQQDIIPINGPKFWPVMPSDRFEDEGIFNTTTGQAVSGHLF